MSDKVCQIISRSFRDAFTCLALLLTLLAGPAPAETLPNGIQLPEVWPPHLATLPDSLLPPPYLVAPPKVVPIVGRQLFVDDFLIEQTNLTRSFHQRRGELRALADGPLAGFPADAFFIVKSLRHAPLPDQFWLKSGG